MKLHTLKPAEGSTKSSKRIGRGQGSTRGGTSTRGHKGGKSRSGYSAKKGFEGGQMPLQRRTPKRGFNNVNRVEYVGLNLDTAQKIIDKYNLSAFSFEQLYAHKIVKKFDKIKLLGRGELKSGINFEVHACSEKAKAAVENAGGDVTIIGAAE
ncbi:MAG: 50S ribosomal protein L15 [Chitinophagales bacterium]|nr:50S ribosomal protein L15 [Bacteroidota bacterium]MCB9042862.1 50S ribosomal protein L15 [Chitinophagales bacterium]